LAAEADCERFGTGAQSENDRREHVGAALIAVERRQLAPMNIGGFLGIGDEYRALPWNWRHYNERLDA